LIENLFITTVTRMSLRVQDVGEVSMTKADYDIDDDYFGFSGISSGKSSCPVNDINENELQVLQFLEETRRDMVVLNNFPRVKALYS